MSTSLGQEVTFQYRNWKGITAQRRVVPQSMWFGATEWHSEPQWLLTAIDVEKNESRDFAMQDISDWSPARED